MNLELCRYNFFYILVLENEWRHRLRDFGTAAVDEVGAESNDRGLQSNKTTKVNIALEIFSIPWKNIERKCIVEIF